MRRIFLSAAATVWLAAVLATVHGQNPSGLTPAKRIELDEQTLKTAKLDADSPALLAFLCARTLTEIDRGKVEVLIAQLGAIAFRTREQAAQELIAKGPVVVEQLKQNLNHADAEIGRRCEKCIQKIKEHDQPPEVLEAVLRLLAARKAAGAVETILAYLPFADSESTADEARTALSALAVRDGKTDAALVAALADKEPVRRAAAAEALVRAGAADGKEALRALLVDKNSTVRWRVATVLVKAKDKEALSVLIDLLPEATQAQAWQIEDILYCVGEGKAPPQVPLGVDDAGRIACRDAWQVWWKQNAGKIDLAVLEQTPRLLGFTTVVLLDMGRVLEVDVRDAVRWQIDNLQFPLDVQVLPGETVLIVEHQANRVTERSFKGEVVWRQECIEPQMAQRLPNGNTFIGSKYQLLEVDAAGKKVFQYNVPGSEGIMKCMKASAGQIVCLFEDGRVVWLDAAGKELSSFRIDLSVRLFGGRIQALPNGRVLIPHHGENKVVEYDSTGKEVWQVKVDQPIVAVRLPNGNTIVTSMNQNRAVEFDRNGKEVWQYRSTTRVTRAVRR